MNKPFRKSLFASQETQSHLYLSPSWRQHEQVVMHLSQLSQNVILIIAPQEGGKTTFLQHLFGKETPGLHKVVLGAKAHTSVEELYKQIALSFGLEDHGAQATCDALFDLQASKNEGVIHTLLIDDAHLLSNEQLEALVQLVNHEAPAFAQLRLVLFGEPSLELRLFSPEFSAISNGRIYTIELESWSLQDVNAFFNMSNDVSLTKDQIATLFEQSAGLPGLIVREKMSALQNGTATGKNMTKRKFTFGKFHPISLGILAGLAIGGSYLIYNNATSEEDATIAPINAAQTTENNDASQASAPKATSPAVAFHFDKVDTSDIIEDDMKQEHDEMTKPRSQNELHANPKLDTPKAAVVPAPTNIAQTETKLATEQVVVANETKSVAVNDKAVEIEKAPAKEAPLAKEKQALQKPQKATQTVASKGLTPQENYLMSIDKKNYTLQLLGSSKEESIKQFVKKHSLEDATYSFHTKRQGKDWYIVVYGNYQTADEAKLAAQNMSDSLKSSQIQPWVRELGAIHKDIKLQQG